MKFLRNKLHANERSFFDTCYPLREASKWLRSEEREYPLTSSVFISSIYELHSSLNQSLVSLASNTITGMQSQNST